MTKKDLELIFIRAQDKQGNWNSYSLAELLQMGEIGTKQVVDWLIQKLVTSVYDIENGQAMTEDVIVKCVEKLDALGIPVVRINPELLKVASMNDPLKKEKVKN